MRTMIAQDGSRQSAVVEVRQAYDKRYSLPIKPLSSIVIPLSAAAMVRLDARQDKRKCCPEVTLETDSAHPFKPVN
jgi:hypothetical protein